MGQCAILLTPEYLIRATMRLLPINLSTWDLKGGFEQELTPYSTRLKIS